MRTLKMIQKVLAVLVLLFMTGCSDQITSTSDQSTNPASSGIPKEKVSETADEISVNTFSARIKLSPNREYEFNVSNTGLVKFTGISVERIQNELSRANIEKNCRYISVISDKDTKSELALSCRSKGFEGNTITLKNVTSKLLELNVYLQGVKVKKISNSEW